MPYLTQLARGFVPFSLKALFVFVLIILTILLGSGIFFYQMQRSITDSTRQLSVQGTAKTKVTPDSAQVVLGKNLRGSNVVELQDKATAAVNSLVAKLTEAGVEDKEIQTSGYNLTPVYNADGDIKTYAINISVQITLEKSNPQDELISKVLAAGKSAGIDEVRNLNFYLADQKEVARDLEDEAVADAKAEAEKLARTSGIRLGAVKNVYANGNYPIPYYSTGVAEAAPTSDDAKSSRDLDVKAGEFDLQTTVTLVYEIL